MEQKKHSYQVAVAANQNVRERDYWLEKLAGASLKTGFLYDFKKVEGGQAEMASWQFSLQGELFSKLMALSRGMDHTLHIVLAASLSLLLNKYCGSGDILIGTPIYKQDVDSDFINTFLVLRNRLGEDMSFKELLLQMKQTVLEAAENQNYPLQVLPEKMHIPVKDEGNPFFDIALLLENIHDKKYLRDAGYNMLFSFLKSEKNIDGIIEYNTDLYRQETVQRLPRHLLRIMEIVVPDVAVNLKDIDLLTEDEKRQILSDFNDTDMEYPQYKTVCGLFADQVEKTPGNIAVFGPGYINSRTGTRRSVFLTYAELNCTADKIARVLVEKGIQADTIAAVIMTPSIEMVAALWAILKAGGAYLPIEPEYPVERISYMLADSGAAILLTTRCMSEEVEKFRSLEVETVFMEQGRGEAFPFCSSSECFAPTRVRPSGKTSVGARRVVPSEPATSNTQPVTCPINLAYVIYTSGSTGKPKGVLVQHGSLLANLFAFLKEFDIKPADRVIQLSDYTFDAFAEEFYPVLLRGGNLTVPGLGEYLDIQKLGEFMLRHKVTIVDCSPLLLNELNKLDLLQGVRIFISGGDVLRENYVDRLLETGDVYNTYGPTETTVCVTYFKYEKEIAASIPIGRPIANYKVYIVNEYLKLLPVGVVGEICIAGAGVTRGYLNRPELTAEKFIKAQAASFNFHRSYRAYTSYRSYFYKTGDLGRWLPDGNIEFHGRKDHQVKIRGFRIETGEIESLLLQKPGIKEAAVTVWQGKEGDKYLCAYIVPENTAEGAGNDAAQTTELRQYLSKCLPDFMIPAFFVSLQKLPLTSGGKVDRRALPEPEIKASVEYVEPRDEIEKRVREIWQEVLDLERIGVFDNFFEIGGHSLNATVMIARLRSEFNFSLPLTEIFSSPTISQVAGYIRSAAAEPGVESIADENLVLLKKGNLPNNHLFFIHGGTGTAEIFVDFCNHLSPHWSCWGFQADRLENYMPRTVTIAGIASKYLEKMKKVQPHGPYRIAGWCIGGTIGFEIVRMLEQLEEGIGFLGIISAPPPAPEQARITAASFTLESERQSILRDFKDKQLAGSLKEVTELRDVWQKVVDYFASYKNSSELFGGNIPENIAAAIPNADRMDVKDLIYHLNMVKTLARARNSYLPGEKIKAGAHYFDAAEQEIRERRQWNNYSGKAMQFYEVPGDHFSMFEMPHAAVFAKLFDSFLP